MTNRLIRHAMHDSDNYVLSMEYRDAKGNTTTRLVSPIRFMGSYRILALCPCREEPRPLWLARCSNSRRVPASDVLMPVEIREKE